MSSNETRAAILEQAIRAALDRDRSVIEELFTNDARVWTPTLSTSSVDELIDALERRDDSFAEIEIEVRPLDVNGDYACVEWTAAMTHIGSIALDRHTRLEPTGTRVSLHGVTVAEFVGERICSVRQYWDELELLDQLGVLAGDED